MRTGIIIAVGAAYRIRLETVLVDRNSPQKHVWRARIALLSAGARHADQMERKTLRNQRVYA
jgi:hypothetical protein